MITVDLEYRALALAFQKKGPSILPKKRSRYEKQQALINESTDDLDNKKISIGEFLEKIAHAMIHEKFYKLVEAASDRLENPQGCEENNENEIEEHIMAISFSLCEITLLGGILVLCEIRSMREFRTHEK